MKFKWLLLISATLFVAACGEQKPATGESVPDIEEFNRSFPRTFSSNAQYRNELGEVIERSSYQPFDPSSVFGCISNGMDFTFVMRNGSSDQLRIRLLGIRPRESMEEYYGIRRVELDGISPGGGFLFDSKRAGSSLQVEYCDLKIQWSTPNKSGQLTCRNVTSQRAEVKQGDLIVNFNCPLVE